MGQAVEVKTFAKGMNKDVDPRFLPNGEYIDAENIMLSNYRDGRAGGLTSLPGIERLENIRTMVKITVSLTIFDVLFEFISITPGRITAADDYLRYEPS